MIPEPSEEIRELVSAVGSFVRKEILPVEALVDPAAREIPHDEVKRLQGLAKASGYWMFAAPREYGGCGLSAFELVQVNEEAAKFKYSFSSPVFGRTPPVVLYDGTRAQIEKYVLPAIDEAWTTFTAISEPTGGSDPARSIRTTARRERNCYVLNGTKLWTTNAESARYGVVYARTGSGRAGISAFVVEAGTPGMTVHEVPVMRNHWTNEVRFDDCKIPLENLIGNEGQGFQLAQSWTFPNRLNNATFGIGVATEAIRLAKEWASERSTFGELLSTRQGVQFPLADSIIETNAARLLVHDAAHACDVAPTSPQTSLKVSMAKVYGTEIAFNVVDRAIQILGGMGVSKELPLEHWFRDLRVSRLVEGPSEVHRYVIARDLFGEAAMKRKSS